MGFWEKEELKRNQDFKVFEEIVGIAWMSRSEFSDRFQVEYKDRGRYLNKVINFKIRMDDIRSRIRQPPMFTPPEEDFPGPVERWYGSYDGHLFHLTHYYGLEIENSVACEDDEVVINLITNALTKFREINPYDPRT